MTTLRGGIYGAVQYGQVTYGQPGQNPDNPLYSTAPLQATAQDYYTIQLTWEIPTAGVTLQLVRNNYSIPANQNDGLVLFSQGILASALYVDTALSLTQQGTFQYYTLWNQDSSGAWWRAADCQALLPKSWGYGARLFSLLPGYYQDLDNNLAAVLAIAPPPEPSGTAQARSSAEGDVTAKQGVAGTTEATSEAAVTQTSGGTAGAASSAQGNMANQGELESLFNVEGESTTYGGITSYDEDEE